MKRHRSAARAAVDEHVALEAVTHFLDLADAVRKGRSIEAQRATWALRRLGFDVRLAIPSAAGAGSQP